MLLPAAVPTVMASESELSLALEELDVVLPEATPAGACCCFARVLEIADTIFCLSLIVDSETGDHSTFNRQIKPILLNLNGKSHLRRMKKWR